MDVLMLFYLFNREAYEEVFSRDVFVAVGIRRKGCCLVGGWQNRKKLVDNICGGIEKREGGAMIYLIKLCR